MAYKVLTSSIILPWIVHWRRTELCWWICHCSRSRRSLATWSSLSSPSMSNAARSRSRWETSEEKALGKLQNLFSHYDDDVSGVAVKGQTGPEDALRFEHWFWDLNWFQFEDLGDDDMAPTFQNAHLDYHIEVQHLREEVTDAFLQIEIFCNRSLWWLDWIDIIIPQSSFKTRRASRSSSFRSQNIFVPALRGWFPDPAEQKAFSIHLYLLPTQVSVTMKRS